MWFFIFIDMKCVSIWKISVNLMNQYCPNDWCVMFQDPLKVQDKLMDFTVTVWKVLDMVSNSTFHLSLRNHHLLSFSVASRRMYNYLKGLHICARLNSLHVLILQPKQRCSGLKVEAVWMQKQICSYLLLSQILKKFAKM